MQTQQSATETKVVLRSFCQLESGFADRRVQRIEDTLSTVDPGRLSVHVRRQQHIKPPGYLEGTQYLDARRAAGEVLLVHQLG